MDHRKTQRVKQQDIITIKLSHVKLRNGFTAIHLYHHKDAPLSDLLKQHIIKTENQLMDFSDSIPQYFPDTGRITEIYMIFYQGGKFTMAHMFQDQLLNQVYKVSTMQHALQELIWHISGY